jgi:hypothetical protein
MRKQLASRVSIIACSLMFLACSESTDPSEPTFNVDALSASRAGLTCTVLEATGTNPLGIIPAGFEGAGGLGGMPGPFTVGSITGTLHSYLTSPVAGVGAKGQGATHITLRHVFTSGDGSFYTDDKAVCAPDPNGIATCRLMDQMTVAGGTGVFEGATGKMHNQGFLNFATFTLSFHLKGQICGAGL